MPPEISLEVARQVKERFSYLSSDIVKVWTLLSKNRQIFRNCAGNFGLNGGANAGIWQA